MDFSLSSVEYILKQTFKKKKKKREEGKEREKEKEKEKEMSPDLAASLHCY